MGLCSLIGRLGSGVVSDMGFSPIFLSAFCNVMSATTMIAIPFHNTFWFFALCCALHGIFSAAHHVLNSAIVLELMDKDVLSKGVCVLLISSGFGVLLGSYLVGFLFTETNDDLWPCIASGVLTIVGALIMECCHLYRKYSIGTLCSPVKAKFSSTVLPV